MSELLSTATGHCSEESRTCFCGLTCYIQTSTSKANRGRKYFGCPKFRDGSHCKFLYGLTIRLMIVAATMGHKLSLQREKVVFGRYDKLGA
ncbi:hypothetical protein SLA2020_426340 [Shorea laevis]